MTKSHLPAVAELAKRRANYLQGRNHAWVEYMQHVVQTYDDAMAKLEASKVEK